MLTHEEIGGAKYHNVIMSLVRTPLRDLNLTKKTNDKYLLRMTTTGALASGWARASYNLDKYKE